jgi:hypothetical protein
VQDVFRLSVDQLKAELLSRGVSIKSRMSKRDLQVKLCELLPVEIGQSESHSVESDASSQTNEEGGELQDAAISAPPSPAHTEVTFKTLPSSVAGLTADQIFELERMRIQMQMRQAEIEIDHQRQRHQAEIERLYPVLVLAQTF